MFKASEVLRFLAALAGGVLLLGLVMLRVTGCATTSGPAAAPPPEAAHAQQPPPPPAPPDETRADCRAPAWTAAAAANAGSLSALAWTPFGRPETGWEIYVPLIQHEIGTTCPAGSEVFAERLAAWARERRLTDDGILTEANFAELKFAMLKRRDFVRLTSGGVCPDGANDVIQTFPKEGYHGKPLLVRPGALAAYRRMMEAARREVPELAQSPDMLTIFSGYRSPVADAQRCVAEGNCNGVVRARCSAHRTGLALDLYMGQAPGYGADSTADPNRLFMVRTPAYRWMVANAGRFGFVNYPFEPWHWEWNGEAP